MEEKLDEFTNENLFLGHVDVLHLEMATRGTTQHKGRSPK